MAIIISKSTQKCKEEAVGSPFAFAVKGPAEIFGMTSRSIWMDGFWPCAKKKVCHMSPQKGRQKSVNEMIRTLPDYHGHSRRRS